MNVFKRSILYITRKKNKKYYYVIYIIWNINGSFKWNFN